MSATSTIPSGALCEQAELRLVGPEDPAIRADPLDGHGGVVHQVPGVRRVEECERIAAGRLVAGVLQTNAWETSLVDMPPVAGLDGTRVLVVDDDVDTLEVMKTLLDAHGAHTAIAASAAEGLELAQAFQPDVVLSDIAMPEEDGYMFVRRLRRLAPHANRTPPVVAVTAHLPPEDRARALSAGFQAFLEKPVALRTLLACIRCVHRIAANERREPERRQPAARAPAAGIERRIFERRRLMNCAALLG